MIQGQETWEDDETRKRSMEYFLIKHGRLAGVHVLNSPWSGNRRRQLQGTTPAQLIVLKRRLEEDREK